MDPLKQAPNPFEFLPEWAQVLFVVLVVTGLAVIAIYKTAGGGKSKPKPADETPTDSLVKLATAMGSLASDLGGTRDALANAEARQAELESHLRSICSQIIELEIDPLHPSLALIRHDAQRIMAILDNRSA